MPFDVTGTASVETVKVPLGVCCHAGLEAADGDDLVSGPDLDGEGAGSTTQYSVGANVEGL